MTTLKTLAPGRSLPENPDASPNTRKAAYEYDQPGETGL